MRPQVALTLTWKAVKPRLLPAVIAAVILTTLGLACGPADEPTATPAPTATAETATAAEATATPAPTEAEPTATSESVARPTATPEPAGEGTEDTTQPTVRPEITSGLLDRLPTMTIDEVLDTFPRTWPAEFEADEIKRGGVFRIATSWDTSKWDPRITSAGGTATVSNVVYNRLVMYDVGPDAEVDTPPLVPDLAESWGYNDDATKLTFKLRQGMHWGDLDDPFQQGPEVVAEDIKWTLNEYKTNSVSTALFDTVASIETPDRYTVVLNFSQPSFWLLPNLGLKDFPMFNPHLFKQDRQDREAIGTGPFILVDQQKSMSVSMEANPNYFKTNSRGESLPYLDGIEWIIAPDAVTRIALLRTGKVEHAYAPIGGTPKEAQAVLQTNPNLIVVPSVTDDNSTISYNQNNPVLQDPNARRALTLAMNVRGASDVVFSGLAAPLDSDIAWWDYSDGLPSWDQVDELYGEYVYHYDAERAKELWSQAGYGEVTFPFPYYRYNPAMPDFFGLLVDDLNQIGVTLKLQSQDYSHYNSQLAAASFETVHFSWAPDWGDVASAVFQRFHKDGATNRENINDPELNSLAEDILLVTTKEEQREIMLQARERVHDQVYLQPIPLSPTVSLSIFYQPWVKNMRYGRFQGGYYYWGNTLDQVWLDR